MTLSMINATGGQLALEDGRGICHIPKEQVTAMESLGKVLFRYVCLVLPTVRLTVNIAVHAVRRRRARRVRRYANPGPARPSVVTGLIPLIRSRSAVA